MARENESQESRVAAFGDEGWPALWEGLFPRRRLFRDWAAERTPTFVPAVEVSENDTHYLISVEVPGATKDDIHVDLREGMLVIHGEKKSEREEKKERSHYVERAYGSFSRGFTLPADADADRLEATFKDGVLKLSIPRSEATKPRKIAIRGG